MQKMRFAVAIATILITAVAHAQPALPGFPPAPPFEELALQGPQIGLLANAREALPAKSLMVLGRQLTPEELKAISRADEVAEVLGIPGQNYLGSMAHLAVAPGAFQYGVIASQRGDNAQAAEALEVAARTFPDAKIVHRYLGKVYRTLGDTDTAMRHLTTSIGYIPLEDEIFATIISSNAELLPELGPPPTQGSSANPPASVATLARSVAALLMFGRDTDASQIYADITARNATDTTYPELAAAAVTELASMAMERVLEMEELEAQDEEASVNFLMAAIGACDGRWRQDCLPNLDIALTLSDDEEIQPLIICAIEIASRVISGAWEGPHGMVPDSARTVAGRYPDAFILQKLIDAGS